MQVLEYKSTAPADDGINFIPADVALARAAQRQWALVPLAQRLMILRRIRHAIAREGTLLAGRIDGSNRSPGQRLIGEVLPLADAIQFLERRAAAILRPTYHGSAHRPLWLWATRLEVHRDPFGIVLIVAPSNYPLLLPGVQAVQALAAGNAVLLKPAPGGEAAITQLRRMAIDAGLNPALLTILPSDESSVPACIASGIDKLFLTGSAETGAAILSRLAPHLIPSTMELSGCDAAFVCPDADLDLVVRGLIFALGFNGGATCIAPRRVFVPRVLEPELRTRLLEKREQMSPVRIGPRSLAAIKCLLECVLQEGARVAGGVALGADLMTPAIVFGVDCNSKLLRADLMGPVMTIVPVNDMDHALRLNESCPYALGATVFGFESTARELAARIEAGVVLINDVMVPHADPRLPFGGRGRSGFGVTRGAEGLLEMTRQKAVSIRRGRLRPHLDPALAGDDQMFAHYLVAAHGGGIGNRCRAVARLLKSMVRRGKNK